METNFDKMPVSDFIKLAETEHGKEQIKDYMKTKFTSSQAHDHLLTMTETFYNLTLELGQKTANNKDKILNIVNFCDYIASIPDKEAIKEIHDILSKIDNNDEFVEQLYKKPKSFTQPLTKAVTKIFDGETDLSEMTGLDVGMFNKKPTIVNVQVLVAVLDPNENIFPKTLTPFDREVFNAVCSILATEQTTMTPRQIYEAMTGKPSTSQQAINSIIESMIKMQTTSIKLDWLEHAKQKGIKENELASRGIESIGTIDSIIPSRTTYVKANGQMAFAFMIKDEPILFTYAKMVKQISTTDKKVLQVSTISNTEENIVIKNFLIRQVEHMRINKDWNPTLTFDTIFKNCGITTTKNHLPRKRNVIFSILDYWKEIHYIKNYKVKKNGREYKSITIELHSK